MDLVPKAIDEFILEQAHKKRYWNIEEFRTKSRETDLIHLGEYYIELRSKGKELAEIGKYLYSKGEKKGLPGFIDINN
jgi:uncharacterized Zn finger protein